MQKCRKVSRVIIICYAGAKLCVHLTHSLRIPTMLDCVGCHTSFRESSSTRQFCVAHILPDSFKSPQGYRIHADELHITSASLLKRKVTENRQVFGWCLACGCLRRFTRLHVGPVLANLGRAGFALFAEKNTQLVARDDCYLCPESCLLSFS